MDFYNEYLQSYLYVNWKIMEKVWTSLMNTLLHWRKEGVSIEYNDDKSRRG